MKDANNFQQGRSGNGIREYLGISAEFVDFIRALFYAISVKKGLDEKRCDDDAGPTKKPKIPTVKVLGNEFQLKLRDGFRNENRIAVFKMAVNRRRVTMITGVDCHLEWVSLYSE